MSLVVELLGLGWSEEDIQVLVELDLFLLVSLELANLMASLGFEYGVHGNRA